MNINKNMLKHIMRKKNIVFLLFIICIKYVTSDFVDLEKYPGNHDSSCLYGTSITGNIVKNKIYTFGECYPLSAIDNFDDINNILFGNNIKYNVTDLSYVYDIENDKWDFETFSIFPLVHGYTQVVGSDIYFFDVKWNTTKNNRNSDMWIYNTITKKWIQKDDLPFNWHGSLITCENDGKIYFTGSDNGFMQKNIIQIYDTKLNIWKKPIILSQKLILKYMIFKDNKFHFLGQEIDKNNGAMIGGKREGIITIYSNMTYKFTNLKMNFYQSSISNIDNYLYVFGGDKNNDQLYVTRINLDTHTKKNIEYLPSPIKNSLSVPYKNNIYIFGGMVKKRKYKICDDFDEDCIPENNEKNSENNEIKVFNHKFIPPKQNNNDNLLKFKIQN